jgi:ribosomal protein S18 acetylase RimI-like enzyme
VSAEPSVRLLQAPVRIHVLPSDQLAGFEPLLRFVCGERGKATEEVHTIVGRLHSGEAVPQTVLLLEERAGDLPGHGALVGVCGLRQLKLFDQIEGLAEMPVGGHINVIATDRRYRGVRVEPGGQRAGHYLMSAALAQVRAEFGGGPMPYVWAKVLLGNRASNELFLTHGFERPFPPPMREVVLRPGERGNLVLQRSRS